ncbi:MAG: DUF1735 domain-containing protein, partial [Sphingobacteriales bacterium]
VLMFSLSSCLKDDNIDQDFTKLSASVLFESLSPNGEGASNTLDAQFLPSEEPSVFDVAVLYASSNKSPGINVSFELAPDVLTKYNEVMEAEVELAPADAYTITGNSVTIASGTNRAIIPVTIETMKLDPSKLYGIPLTITNSSGVDVRENFKTVIVLIAIKNEYDGVYNYKSAADQSLNGGADENGAELITVDATTVRGYLVNTYTNQAYYKVDPTTNLVTVRVDPSIGAVTTDPSSHWDPETRTLYAKWTAGSRKFEETYTRTGGR